MKAKVSRGGGFLGALQYVFDVGPDATGDKKSELCGGNMSGNNPAQLSREFGLTKKLRPDCEKPVWHCSLALPVGERLSKEKWGEIASAFMLEMGMDPNNFLYIAARHNDKAQDHIHVVASRIGLDSSLWHGGRDVFTAIEATQKLEKEFGLTLTPGFDTLDKKDIKPLSSKEIYMGMRLEMKPPRMVCQEAIDQILKDKNGLISAPEFINLLSVMGVRAVPSVASTGTMNGFSFEVEGIPFKGSQLGDSYKWAQLQKRGVEYVKDRDFEDLAIAKRLAAARSGTEQHARPYAGAIGQNGAASAEPGELAQLRAVADLGSGSSDRSDEGARPDPEDAHGRSERAGGVRRGDEGAALDAGELGRGAAHQAGVAGRGDEQARSDQHGIESGGSDGRADTAIGPNENHGIDSGDAAEEQRGLAGATAGDRDSGDRFSEVVAPGSEGNGTGNARGQTPLFGDAAAANTGSVPGRNAGRDWTSQFRKASAAQRNAAKRGSGLGALGKSNAAGEKVADGDRLKARTIDPTAYLESVGFEVKKEGRHLSVRQNGDEIYRVTRKDDGHYVACDCYESGIGDNIAFVRHLEPGTGFAQAVYRLAGAPSVAMAMARPAPAPAPRQPPTMPVQADADVTRGRAYLEERGISLETIQHAEKTGMLRYSAGAVLFVGRDEAGTAQNVMRRSVDASEAVQKRDLRGTDKRHPQRLSGDPDTVWIVEGGTDALAVHDMARIKSRPVPTVLVSGGANVRGFMQTPWVQKVLQLAKRVIVAFERESSAEVQAKTDAAHEVQMQRLREMCSAEAEVMDWQPPEGVKDVAALNGLRIR